MKIAKILTVAALGLTMANYAVQPVMAAPKGPGAAKGPRVAKAGKGPRAQRGMDPAKYVAHLEQVLGKTLNDEQKTAVTAAATTQQLTSKAANDLFMQQVAGALNTTEDDVKSKLKGQKGAAGEGRKRGGGTDGFIAQLTAAGYTVSDVQKASLTTAVETRTTATKAATSAMHESVAKALGLTVDELKAKEKEYRKANPREKKAA